MGLIDYLSRNLVSPAVATITAFISKLKNLDTIILNELVDRKRAPKILIGKRKKCKQTDSIHPNFCTGLFCIGLFVQTRLQSLNSYATLT